MNEGDAMIELLATDADAFCLNEVPLVVVRLAMVAVVVVAVKVLEDVESADEL